MQNLLTRYYNVIKTHNYAKVLPTWDVNSCRIATHFEECNQRAPLAVHFACSTCCCCVSSSNNSSSSGSI